MTDEGIMGGNLTDVPIAGNDEEGRYVEIVNKPGEPVWLSNFA